ncbi:dTMP kinase [Thermosulfidibacter takaii ABI70S6]|uniref:Thymidylate kinase n=1 Tax=Thermosulfidibacter takaii (strain DSM 17441 / JCM 13301 / NBRC 103674 / ABI70S6) TaxID=1298851 RepID=A0A0S3QW69_THET7|nr:dTMP kinase [Thermosulfidibacter takaii]BAT72567.1 dTMP kinase [Thermosulfidibacter takaii ABI70S6]
MKSLYIAFEGVEGCGKSTLCQLTHKWLREMGIAVIVTQEPGGTSIGNQLRKILLHKNVDPYCELFLYLADRAQHTKEVIIPSLQRGKTILSDRCYLSTLAYQGYARELMDLEELVNLNNKATYGIFPDIIFLLDIDPAISLSRIQNKDRIEQEGLEFHRKVREGYLKLSEKITNVVVLNAEKTSEELLTHVKEVLQNHLS